MGQTHSDHSVNSGRERIICEVSVAMLTSANDPEWWVLEMVALMDRAMVREKGRKSA